MSRTAVGFDVGGSGARSVLYDENNTGKGPPVYCRASTRTWQFDELLSWIAEEYRRLSPDVSLPVGVALPGVIDGGMVVRSVNLPWLEGQPMKKSLEVMLGRRVDLMTDAQAATWGEFIQAGRPTQPFAHLRLGTGVACAIFTEGKLLPTDPQRRTHWPALIVDNGPQAPLCPCGLRGCLELYAGGHMLELRASEIGLDNIGHLNNLNNGPKTAAAQQVLHRAAAATGQALQNLVNKFGVSHVALDGGVLKVIPVLMDRIQEAVSVLNLRVDIQKGRLGPAGGVIGAAMMALDATSRG